jgi:hypothetical protein
MSQTHAAAQAAGPDRAAQLSRLRMSSLGAVIMLILEFVLGIIYNLYGTAPTSTKSIGLFSSPVLALHVILALLLLIAAVGQLIRAISLRHPLSVWLSAAGLAAIVAAGGAGLGFTGHGASAASLVMSLAFAVALACYVAMAVVLPGPAAAASSGASSAGASSAGASSAGASAGTSPTT